MEFVLVDDSVVTAFQERSSRMLENIHKLQDKMAGIFSGAPVEFERSTSQNIINQSETIDYSEQVQTFDSEVSSEVNQMMNDIDFGIDESQQVDHVVNDISDEFDDFDLDLDAMLDGITIDGSELEL